ncbi:MAG: PKD domain-containing protein [Bdellovibrio sp.]|nr:PKD domain-containing protein [Bdellovibrio sp.]
MNPDSWRLDFPVSKNAKHEWCPHNGLPEKQIAKGIKGVTFVLHLSMLIMLVKKLQPRHISRKIQVEKKLKYKDFCKVHYVGHKLYRFQIWGVFLETLHFGSEFILPFDAVCGRILAQTILSFNIRLQEKSSLIHLHYNMHHLTYCKLRAWDIVNYHHSVRTHLSSFFPRLVTALFSHFRDLFYSTYSTFLLTCKKLPVGFIILGLIIDPLIGSAYAKGDQGVEWKSDSHEKNAKDNDKRDEHKSQNGGENKGDNKENKNEGDDNHANLPGKQDHDKDKKDEHKYADHGSKDDKDDHKHHDKDQVGHSGRGPVLPLIRRGVVIFPNFLNPATNVLTAGETTTITGDTCLYKLQGADSGRCQNFKKSSIKFLGSFPDALTDVTSDVELSYKKDKISFSYTTPPLIEQDGQNSFQILVLSRAMDLTTLHLYHSHSKVVFRIIHIERKLKHVKSEERREALLTLKSKFEVILAKIDQALNERPEVLARLTYPVQISNSLSGAYHLSSIFDGQRLAISGMGTLPFSGESREYRVTSKNLSSKGIRLNLFDDDQTETISDSRLFSFKVQLNDIEIDHQGPLKLGLLEEFQKTVNIKHAGEIFPKIGVRLFKVDEDGKETLWGKLISKIPWSEDNLAPRWDDNLIPLADQHYFKALPAINGRLFEEIGRLDQSTIRVALDGQTDQGETVSRDLVIQLTSPDQWKSAVIAKEEEIIEDGSYRYQFFGKDLNQAEAIPYPVVRTFVVDNTPPTLSINQTDNIYTKESIFQISGVAVDKSDVTIYVYLNDLLALETTNKNFLTDLTLAQNQNKIRIYAVDSLNNRSADIVFNNIVLDQTPPIILTQSLGNIFTNNASFSPSFEIQEPSPVTINAFLNGTKVYEGTEKIFTIPLTLIENSNELKLLVLDAALNSSELILSNIVLDTIAPIVSVDRQGGVITNNASFPLNINVTEANASQTTLVLNGQTIGIFSEKSISQVFTLKSGVNSIEVKCADIAGNSASTIILSDIVLDTVPPAILTQNHGNFITNQASFTPIFEIQEASAVMVTAFLNGTKVYEGTDKMLPLPLTLREDSNEIKIVALDAAQNSSEFILGGIVLDTIAPMLATDRDSNYITQNASFSLNITVNEKNNSETTILLNGQSVGTFTEKQIAQILTLSSGINWIEIQSVDSAGNSATSISLSNIVLDNSGPILSNILPADGALISIQPFLVSGTSNEELLSVLVNGQTAAISLDKRSFSANISLAGGPIGNINIVADDLAGNQSTTQISVALETVNRTVPEIAIFPASGKLINAIPIVEAFITGPNQIDYKRLRIKLNETPIPSNKITVDPIANKVRINFDYAFSLLAGQLNVLSIFIGDEFANVTTQAVAYEVRPTPDVAGPLFNFEPGGGHLETTTPIITIGMSDESGIKFNTLQMTLNDMPVPERLIQKFANLDRIVITLDESFPLSTTQFNILNVLAQDNKNNVSIGSVGFDTLAEQIIILSLGKAGNLYPAGANHNCAIINSGDLRCWGLNNFGQLGLAESNPYITQNKTPAELSLVNVGTAVTKVATGGAHTCVIVLDGKVKCWGDNRFGQLGYGNTTTLGIAQTPANIGFVDVGGPVKSLALGRSHTCALLTNGAVRCWGDNSYGKLGYGHPIYKEVSGGGDPTICDPMNPMCLPPPPCDPIMNPLCLPGGGGGPIFVQVSADTIGSVEYPSVAGDVVLHEAATQIIAGNSHTCALLSSGRVKCWGFAGEGQLGSDSSANIGDDEDPFQGFAVNLLANATQIVTGGDHSCALLESGQVQCWGVNRSGQLGIGQKVDPLSNPLLVLGFIPEYLGRGWDQNFGGYAMGAFGTVNLGASATAISAGGGHSCALLSSGQIKCWGSNYAGALGLGPTVLNPDLSVGMALIRPDGPVAIGGNVVGINSGGAHSCALMSDLNLRCWGGSAFGELGYGNTNSVGDNEFPESAGNVNLGGAISSGGLPLLSPYFESNPSFGPVPLNVQFSALASFSSSGAIKSYLWTFDDGTTLMTTTPFASHTYPQTGVYIAKLTITDFDNNMATTERIITVSDPNVPPVALLAIDQDDGTLPLKVKFDARNSFHSIGIGITGYKYDFGDGTIFETTSSEPVEHTYNVVKEYTASVTVTSANGLTDTSTPIVIVVRPINELPHPTLACTLDKKTLSCDSSQSLDYDGFIVSSTIDWGDGNIEEAIFGTHTYSAPLPNGLRFPVKLTIVDDRGGSAVIIQKFSVDFTPPNLSNVVPSNNGTAFSQTFTVSGRSDEPLALITANGVPLTLSSDKLSFTGYLTAPVQGAFTIALVATDFSDNTIQMINSINVQLKVLIGSLISVVPSTGGTKLIIVGAPGAGKPGLTVEGDAGFFNTNTARISSDGSFAIEMGQFESATVTATDPETGRTDQVDVSYHVDTTLAGIVRDIEDRSLPGVTVTIMGTNQSTITDATGSFQITNPTTGDQKILIDGTTVPVTITGTDRKFSKTTLSVTIGTLQSNVIEKVIYMAPLMLDGSETNVTASASATVTSPHAPGVTLNIPAGVAIFPDGSHDGKMNLTVIPTDRTTISPPESTVPDTVVALEPSGVKFSEPVELSLPNENEFPPGMDLVIRSKNSETGKWEIDGIAQVDASGLTIKTKEGMGITHYSEVFASPILPEIKQIGAQDRPGANSFNGALTSMIQMPSYKVLGQDMAPGLIYKSNWASPNVILSNLFDIPKNEFYREANGKINAREYTAEYQNTLLTWLEPEYIEAQFFSEGIVSEKMRFTGIPRKSVISYAMDLSNLSSGVFPYFASYKIKLKHMVLQTSKVTATTREGFVFPGGSRTLLRESKEEKSIDLQAFPNDLTGQVFVQNKTKSSAGRGWDIAGVQKIINPDSPRIMIEEADGAISSYALDNTIETFAGMRGSYGAADLKDFDNILIADNRVLSNPNWILDINTNGVIAEVPKFEGYARDFKLLSATKTGWVGWCGNDISYSMCNGWNLVCKAMWVPFQQTRNVAGMLRLSPTQLVGTTEQHELFFINGIVPGYAGTGVFSSIVNNINQDIVLDTTSCTDPNLPLNLNCVGPIDTYDYSQAAYIPQESPDPQVCPVPYSWPYNVPYWTNIGTHSGVGAFADGTFSVAKLNTPKGIVRVPGENSILVADFGNNRIRKVNLDTNVVSTFAGTGQTFDNGDGGQAISASVFHPEDVVFDSYGNLYISGQGGFIRKVDTNGKISTFAGLPIEQGGILADKTTTDKLALNKPSGMVIDEENGYFYIADTGHKRVVRINLATKIAETVAGNGSCAIGGAIGDGGPALNASLCTPKYLGLDDQKNLLIADVEAGRIRRIIFNPTSDGSELASYTPISQDNSRLAKNSDGTFTRIFRDGTVVTFDKNGLQNRVESRNGRVTSFEYLDRKLTAIVDPLGNRTNFNYYGDKLSSILDPAGRETILSYSGDLLTAVEFPDGTTKSFSYANGLMTEEFDQRGSKTSYSYNQYNRLTQITRPDGHANLISDSGSTTAGNNFTGGASGQLQSFGTGQNQQFDGIVNAKNVQTKLVRGFDGYTSSIIDGEGKLTIIERNNFGDPTKITRPDNSQVIFAYNAATRDLISKTDSATGVTTSQTYDSFGNLLTATNARGFTSSNTYDPSTGLLISSTNTSTQTSIRNYFPLGLLKNHTDPLGYIVQYEYAADGRGNVSAIIDPLQNRTTFERDLAGNITKITNAKGQIIRREYNSWNRLTAVISAKGERTEYTYLTTGELHTIKDPHGKSITFEYNNLGQLISKIDQLGNVTTLGYDVNGNVAQEIDANGNIKKYEYNDIDQLVRKILPDNLYEFSYDVRGNLLEAKNNISQINLTYEHFDAGDAVVQENFHGLGTKSDFPVSNLNYDLDQNANRISMQTSVGNFTYTFDSGDRLTNVENHKGENFTTAYDHGNRITEITRPGSKTLLTFDDTNFLTSIQHQKGTNILKFFNFERDSIGNRTKITTGAGVQNLSYDLNNQLISASNPEATTDFSIENFTYDAIGNRTTDQLGNFSFDLSRQRITEDYSYIYVHDNNGNMVSKQKKGTLGQEFYNYLYSSENQLVGFEYYENNVLVKSAEYSFDAIGRRVEKIVIDHANPANSFTRRFVYDRHEILHQLDDSNNILVTYTHSMLGTDDTLAEDVTAVGVNEGLATAATSYFYLKDGLGSITEIVNGSGDILQRYVYSAFGKLLRVVSPTGADLPVPFLVPYFSYTNRELDSENGLYYYRARVYDSAIGRFLQSDPDHGFRGDPISILNKFIYAGNSPIVNIDPLGMFKMKIGSVKISMSKQHFLQAVAIVAIVAIAILVPGAGVAMMNGALIGGIMGAIMAKASGENVKNGIINGAIMGALAAGAGYSVKAAMTPGYTGGTATPGFWTKVTAGVAQGGVAGTYSVEVEGDRSGFLPAFLFGYVAGSYGTEGMEESARNSGADADFHWYDIFIKSPKELTSW